MGKNLEKLYSFRCDEKTIKKLNAISKAEERSRNDQIKYILKRYIREYEIDKGTIETSEQ